MSTEANEGEKPRRIIKRYSNRKLYDTKDSRYVTLGQIGDLVRAGEEVQIVDNATKEDKTEATLALILSEEVKSRPKAVPIATLRELVQERGGKLLSQLREGPIGRLFPAGGPNSGTMEGDPEAPTPSEPPMTEAEAAASKNRLQELVETSRHTIDSWQAAIDERVKAILPPFFHDHDAELKELRERVERLEAKLGVKADKKAPAKE